MQHLGPRRAHPRALAGGENDCQTCAALKMKGDHETYFSTRGGVPLKSRMGNAYNHKIENSLTRNLAWPLRGVQTSLGILPGQERRIASKPEKLVGVKTPKRELTFARLSSIEIKLKRFLKVRRDRAPAKPDSWSSAGRF
jgi:hypothetical protein